MVEEARVREGKREKDFFAVPIMPFTFSAQAEADFSEGYIIYVGLVNAAAALLR